MWIGIELIIAFVLGICLGSFTGVAPGIHINLVAAILISLLGIFSGVPGIVLVVFLAAMAITHTFIDFIPSIYLGAPDDENYLSILPGHRMLLEGKGHEAVLITLYGSLFGLAIVLIFTPIFIFCLPFAYGATKTIMPFLLIFISLYLIFREKDFLKSLVVFILAGFLGFCAMNLPLNEPLLPLLTGLFGVSSLLVSFESRENLPKQKISSIREAWIGKKEALKASVAAAIFAPLCSFLPGIGGGHAAVIGSEIVKQDDRGFLFLIGAINTIVAGLGFVALYAIGKARSGIAIAVQQIIGNISFTEVLIILFVLIVSGVCAFFIAVQISKAFARNIGKINYRKLNVFITGFLVLLCALFSGWLGLLILISSCALGIFCILSNARRINLMGALIIPVIVFYLSL